MPLFQDKQEWSFLVQTDLAYITGKSLSYHRFYSVVTRYYQSHYCDIRSCFLLENKCVCSSRSHSVYYFQGEDLRYPSPNEKTLNS